MDMSTMSLKYGPFMGGRKDDQVEYFRMYVILIG